VFAERVRTHWTTERLARLTGGKQRPICPVDAPHLLRALGILDAHGRLQHRRERKYRQINHLLGFLAPALEELGQSVPDDPVLHVLDAGCGRSALGFVVAWWFARRGRAVRILGIDRNPDVIAGCQARADQLGLPGLTFQVGDLGAVRSAPDTHLGALDGRVDAVLALHACDTATDVALALAVDVDARFVAVAPCCQAELARAWAQAGTDHLGPLHANPHFRRTMGATVTDAMRTALLAEAGFEVRAVEFVEAHHTPKNTLIYGHRRDRVGDRAVYDGLKERSGGIGIALEAWVRSAIRAAGRGADAG
jgi:SAM-dependent methyltransferase